MEVATGNIVAIVAAGVPLTASLIGALVAAVQLTKKFRLKGQAELLRAEIAAVSLSNDRAVLESLHREVTAKTVSLMAIPNAVILKRLTGLLVALLFPFLAGTTTYIGLTAIEISSAGNGLQGLEVLVLLGLATLALFLLYSTSYVWGTTGDLLKTVMERRRVELLYLNGQPLNKQITGSSGIPSDEVLSVLTVGTANTARQLQRRLRVAIWVGASTLSVLMISYGGVLMGLFLETNDDVLSAWVAPFTLIVAFIELLVLPDLLMRGTSTAADERWVHPRPLPGSPEELAAAEAAVGQPPKQHRFRALRRKRRP